MSAAESARAIVALPSGPSVRGRSRSASCDKYAEAAVHVPKRVELKLSYQTNMSRLRPEQLIFIMQNEVACITEQLLTSVGEKPLLLHKQLVAVESRNAVGRKSKDLVSSYTERLLCIFEHITAQTRRLCTTKFANMCELKTEFGALIRKRFRRGHWSSDTLTNVVSVLQNQTTVTCTELEAAIRKATTQRAHERDLILDSQRQDIVCIIKDTRFWSQFETCNNLCLLSVVLFLVGLPVFFPGSATPFPPPP